jgi:hypothetical protein
MKKHIYVICAVLFGFLLSNCNESDGKDQSETPVTGPASTLTLSGSNFASYPNCSAYAMITLEEGKRRLLAVEDISPLLTEGYVKGGRLKADGSVTLNVFVIYLVDGEFDDYEPYTGNETTTDLVFVVLGENDIPYPLPRELYGTYVLANIHLGPTEFINGSAERTGIVLTDH